MSFYLNALVHLYIPKERIIHTEKYLPSVHIEIIVLRCHPELFRDLWDTIFSRRLINHSSYGPLTRYLKLRAAHAPGMPRTFSPPLLVSDPDMHHGTCLTHVPWCMPGSLTSGFLWRRLRGKRSRHCWRMRNPQFYVSGKRRIVEYKRLHQAQFWHISSCSGP